MTHSTIRRTAILLFVLAAALAVAPLRAQDPDMKKLELLDLPGKWWKNPKAIEKLQLTPEQVDRIDGIFLEHRKSLVDLKAKMEKQLMDFRQLAEQPEVKREEVLKLLDQISATRADIARSAILMQLDIRDQLSPEQRTELKKIRETMREELRRRDNRRRMERDDEDAPPQRHR
jgi:Spy/CpxP family protein refolding chaperone